MTELRNDKNSDEDVGQHMPSRDVLTSTGRGVLCYL
jgi:hypothetical protein